MCAASSRIFGVSRSVSISPGASEGARRVAITMPPLRTYSAIFCMVASGIRSTFGQNQDLVRHAAVRDRPVVDEIEVVAGVQNLRNHRSARSARPSPG